jgi:hypothetical protein
MCGSHIWFDLGLGDSAESVTWMDGPLSPTLWDSMSMEEFEWNHTLNMPIIWFLLLGLDALGGLGLVLTKAKQSSDKFQRIGCFYIEKEPILENLNLEKSSIFIV